MRNLQVATVAVLVCTLSAFMVGADRAEAQPGASFYHPLNPCRLFDSRELDNVVDASPDNAGDPFAANSTHYFLVRGSCNVPEEANAVAMTVAAINPAATGHAKVYDSGISQPASSSLNYRSGSGGVSSFLMPRLCFPVLECSGVDLAVFVNQETHFIVDIVGYTTLVSTETEAADEAIARFLNAAQVIAE